MSSKTPHVGQDSLAGLSAALSKPISPTSSKSGTKETTDEIKK